MLHLSNAIFVFFVFYRYKAIILEIADNKYKYHVHFTGFNRTHDRCAVRGELKRQ